MTKISFNQANYSYFAVKRQLLTMNADKYEIGIYDRAFATQPGSSPMLIRYWTE